MEKLIIFLDFDGVLHPGHSAFIKRDGSGAEILSPDPTEKLFMYAPILSKILHGLDDVKLVLSTHWVPVFGYEHALQGLPGELRRRVIGATFDGLGIDDKA